MQQPQAGHWTSADAGADTDTDTGTATKQRRTCGQHHPRDPVGHRSDGAPGELVVGALHVDLKHVRGEGPLLGQLRVFLFWGRGERGVFVWECMASAACGLIRDVLIGRTVALNAVPIIHDEAAAACTRYPKKQRHCGERHCRRTHARRRGWWACPGTWCPLCRGTAWRKTRGHGRPRCTFWCSCKREGWRCVLGLQRLHRLQCCNRHASTTVARIEPTPLTALLLSCHTPPYSMPVMLLFHISQAPLLHSCFPCCRRGPTQRTQTSKPSPQLLRAGPR